MDVGNLGLGVGGGLGVVIIVYLFKYLSTHSVKIRSGCMEIKLEEDRTPKENQVAPLEKLKIDK